MATFGQHGECKTIPPRPRARGTMRNVPLPSPPSRFSPPSQGGNAHLVILTPHREKLLARDFLKASLLCENALQRDRCSSAQAPLRRGCKYPQRYLFVGKGEAEPPLSERKRAQGAADPLSSTCPDMSEPVKEEVRPRRPMRLPSPKQSKGHLRLLHQLAVWCYLLSSQCRWLCLPCSGSAAAMMPAGVCRLPVCRPCSSRRGLHPPLEVHHLRLVRRPRVPRCLVQSLLQCSRSSR